MIQRVRELILEYFPSVSRVLEPSDPLRDNGFTSLMFVELILLLEEQFGIEVLDEEIVPGRFSTVKRISVYVRCKLEGTPIPLVPVCEKHGAHL
ncbi:MAG: acyl carrier protein [Thermodesulfobacteriota bacterium]